LQAQHFNVWQTSGLVLQADGSRRECRTSLSSVQLAERAVNGRDFKPLARTNAAAFSLALQEAIHGYRRGSAPPSTASSRARS